MNKYFLIAFCMIVSITAKSQFLIFLDKGDVFTSPQTDMVVMDKYSFAKLHYTAQKYDTLSKEVMRYDSLLDERDSVERQLREDYENELASKDLQIKTVTESYDSAKAIAQESIDEQKRLQVDYLKLQNKIRRAKRWRNFFIGTTAVLGTIVYSIVR